MSTISTSSCFLKGRGAAIALHSVQDDVGIALVELAIALRLLSRPAEARDMMKRRRGATGTTWKCSTRQMRTPGLEPAAAQAGSLPAAIFRKALSSSLPTAATLPQGTHGWSSSYYAA